LQKTRNNDLADRRIAVLEAKSAFWNAYHAVKAATGPARIEWQAEQTRVPVRGKSGALGADG